MLGHSRLTTPESHFHLNVEETKGRDCVIDAQVPKSPMASGITVVLSRRRWRHQDTSCCRWPCPERRRTEFHLNSSLLQFPNGATHCPNPDRLQQAQQLRTNRSNNLPRASFYLTLITESKGNSTIFGSRICEAVNLTVMTLKFGIITSILQMKGKNGDSRRLNILPEFI